MAAVASSVTCSIAVWLVNYGNLIAAAQKGFQVQFDGRFQGQIRQKGGGMHRLALFVDVLMTQNDVNDVFR